MAWLLFLDESGHDHKQMPYEVRGGVAIEDRRLWAFTRQMQDLEQISFGCRLREFRKELKGSSLLDRKRFRFARQSETMPAEERRRNARAFLMKGLQGHRPTKTEFSAYGQACIEMARGVFQLLREHGGVVFATATPARLARPTGIAEDYLRKDVVFLLERFFYFLEGRKEHGLLVMDGSEKNQDRKFVRQLENYFTKTKTGRFRTQWIVPTPFFVASDMAYPIQVADLCIYCINWSFRLPSRGMDKPVREEIRNEFLEWLQQLQFHGEGYRDGQVFETWGICYVSNPRGADDESA